MINYNKLYSCPKCNGKINTYYSNDFSDLTVGVMERCNNCDYTRITKLDRKNNIVSQEEYKRMVKE